MLSKLKLTLYILTFLLGLTLASSASAAITIRPALNLGLVGYWGMDEGSGNTVYDQSGYGSSGTLSGTTKPVWADGKMGKALNFNGTNNTGSFVDVGNKSVLQPATAITISAWVKPQGTDGNYQAIVVKDSSSVAYWFGLNSLSPYFILTPDGFTQSNATTSASLSIGTWYHLIAVYNGTDQRIYIDGILNSNGSSNPKTYAGGIYSNSSRVLVGKSDYWGGNELNGLIDEVRIYNRALSAGEVTRLYNLTKPKILSASDNGLVGYWSFDEGLGAKAGDMSGNGKNGTITGASWTTGKRGQALSFNGTSNYVDVGNMYNGVKTISFWLKTDTTTNRVIDLNGTAKVELSSGTITTSGITSPTIYVDGAVSSTIDTNWHYVTIKTDTGINASAAKLGQGDSWACGDTLTYCGDNYATVQMTSGYGSQCWLQENLRNTTKPDCTTAITNHCDPVGCGSPWGRLYDWSTAMNISSTYNNALWNGVTGCGAKIQGICPAGWHIPSDYASCSTDDFPALGTDGGALKKVNTSSGVPWTEPNTGATNASNWTGYPSGVWLFDFYQRGNDSRFWSSVESGASYAWFRYVSYNNASWGQTDDVKAGARSVRCVKDTGGGSASYFSGKLDEVRMYNRALSATEVASLYSASKRIMKVNTSQNLKLTTGLVGLWSFNGQDVAGNTAYDRSGSGKNGTITGATLDSGKVGQAISFNGTSNSIDLGNVYNGVKSVTFWVKTADTNDNGYFAGTLDEVRFYSAALSAAEVKRLYNLGAGGTALPMSAVSPNTKIIDLNGTAGIKAVSGTITASGFTSPTIYVDGSAATTIDDNWRFVAITTGTGINASASTLGLGNVVDWTCGDNLSFTYKGSTVEYGTVDVSGQCWMDRNLGASQAATAYNDSASYGDYFQWGRLDDNHQNSNSGTTATNSSTDDPGHGNFITEASSPYDWRSPQNDNLWQAASGYANNPCPSGWHIPLRAEWSTVMTNLGLASCSSNCLVAMASSALKIPTVGSRSRSTGALGSQGSGGSYWSSSPCFTDTYNLGFNSTYVGPAGSSGRAYGFSARCLKN